jgi:hypothetical protein
MFLATILVISSVVISIVVEVTSAAAVLASVM